jgi:glycosyltransferase involved in cell wall biosynthesis
MQCVIVAHDNVFNREVLEDSGIFFPDTDQLNNKIAMLEANKDKYNELAIKAYERVKRYYSWEKMADYYGNVLKNIDSNISNTEMEFEITKNIT